MDWSMDAVRGIRNIEDIGKKVFTGESLDLKPGTIIPSFRRKKRFHSKCDR
ncbi:MAG: hypothetical protein LBH08_02620 [Puniceicoccales bacterium]|jgi:hypothetical protein|nr:hypothetical protein [Puniceicoccales bacterium]